MYIGQQPSTTFDSGIQDRFTGLTTNTVTLTHDISSEVDILVVWNNIVQDSSTYSVGGVGNKTLTLGGTLVSADIVTVYYTNKVMQSVNPTANSVGVTELNLSDGSNGQALTTNGSGTLAFSTVGVSGVSSASSSTALNIDSTGAITKPLQPSFLCLKDGTASNITGDGTVYTIAGWTETIDRNADFNNTSGVFTAPVTGLYLLTVTVYVQGFQTNHADNQVYFNSSNRNYSLLGVTMQSAVGHTGDYVVTGSQIVDMDASDTVSVRMDYRGSGKTIDVHDSTKFGGMLLA